MHVCLTLISWDHVPINLSMCMLQMKTQVLALLESEQASAAAVAAQSQQLAAAQHAKLTQTLYAAQLRAQADQQTKQRYSIRLCS